MCFRAGHVVEVVLGGWRLGMVFPLAQDRLSFLGELGARTASLEGLRTLALVRPPAPQPGTSNTLYCTILYYTILHNTTLYYTILHYTALYYTIQYYITLYYTILHNTTLYNTTLYYTTLYYTILY